MGRNQTFIRIRIEFLEKLKTTCMSVNTNTESGV